MADVTIRNLNFAYEKREILKDINLNYELRDFLAIFGPNGGGKSTLLKLLLGLLQPSSGTIEILGRSPALARAQMGYVPQFIAINKSFPISVLEVVLMGLIDKKIFGFYSKSEREQAMQALGRVGMQDLAGCRISELSGGQRQRVYIARALCANAKILLLDEPTRALDMNYSIEAMSICENLTKTLNLTSVIVLHDLNLASLFCDEILMLKDGVVRYRGSASELFTPQIIKEIYGFDALIVENLGTKFILPQKEKM